MQEGQNIAQYCSRIKDVVYAIRGATSKIDDDILLRKVLTTLLPIYAIIVSVIQELRCMSANDLTLEVLVGRLISFELYNFDNYKSKNVVSSFNAKLSLEKPDEKKKKKKTKYVSSDSNTYEEDVDQLEALKERIFHRGKGKFKGKLHTTCFNYNEVGHIAARCLEKKNYKGGEEYKSIRDVESKITKTKASATLLKKKLKIDLTIMLMKWCMLQ